MQQEVPQLRFATTRLASGLRLHYAEQGDPGGEPIVFLPGYTDSWFSYSRVLPLLPARYHASPWTSGVRVLGLHQESFQPRRWVSAAGVQDQGDLIEAAPAPVLTGLHRADVGWRAWWAWRR